MNDGCLGSGCFLSQLRGRKTEMEGGGKRGGGGGSDRRNLVSVGKTLLSLHMALSDGDKYSELNGAVSDTTDESCWAKLFFPPQIEQARIKMHGRLCKPSRPTSVWYL